MTAGSGRPSPTRRGVLAAATAGAGLLARTRGSPGAARLAGAPAILKPLPPEWFVDYGTNAEMRWDSVRPAAVPDRTGAVVRPQPHRHSRIDASTYRLGSSVTGSRRPRSADQALS